MINEQKKNENLLFSIIDKHLSAVVFVQDYIQLQFDGNIMTILNFPTVKLENNHFEFGDVEYRNKICEQINKRITDICVEEGSVDLHFNDHSIVGVLLDYEKSATPEIIIFQNENGVQIW